MSEHQTRITTQMGGTYQALDGVRSRIDAIERSTRRANTAAKDHQATLSKSLARGGQAVSKVGGSVGSLGGQFAGAAGLGGGFAVAGGVGLAVGVAYKALTAIIDDRVDAEADLLKRTGAYRQALDAAGKKLDQQAIAGLSQDDPIRKLVKRGGSFEKAQSLADELSISDADAANGLADLQLEFGDVKRGILEAAKLATESGQVSFPDAVAALRKDRFAKRLATDGRAGDAAARIVGERIGDKRFTAYQLDQFRRNGSPLLDRFDEADGLIRERGRIDLNGVRSGRARKALQEDLDRARDPEGTETAAVAAAARQAAEGLIEAAKAARVLGSGMAEALDAYKEAWRDGLSIITGGRTAGGSAIGDVQRGLDRDAEARGRALSRRE